MFNDDRKQWYLDECRKSFYELPTVELIIKIFNSTEITENTFSKDVSEFTDYEAIDYFKSLNSKSRQRLKVTAWYLSKYHDWCYEKGIIQNIDDPFDERTIDRIIESIIPVDIVSSQIILENDLKENVDIEPDYINKLLLICPYYGIRGEEFTEISNLKIENLDEINKTVKTITNRIVNVDDYFIEHMKKADCAEKYIKLTEGNNRNYKQTIYVKNGYVVKPCASLGSLFDFKPVSYKFINQRLGNIRKTIGNEYYTVSNLYRSGLINYIKKQYELKDVSLKAAFFQQLNNKLYVYDSETQQYIDNFGSKTTTRMLRMQIKDFIDKY